MTMTAIPIAAPNEDRALLRAEQLRAALHDIGDADFPAFVEAVWRSARGPRRWALAASDRAGLAKSLEDFMLEGSSLATAERRLTRPKTAFVFGGMGPQWSGMGRSLGAASPTFAAAVGRVDDALAEHFGGSVWNALTTVDPDQTLPTEIAQPANFLLQAAMLEVLAEANVSADAIIGHSAGEVAAAYAAGVYDLETAARVAVTRGAWQATVAGRGAMLAVGLRPDEIEAELHAYPGLSIAAMNDDSATTVAGHHEAVAALEAALVHRNVFVRRLRVEVPYHSPAMDEISEPMVADLGRVATSDPHTELYSTVSAMTSEGHQWGADYWAANIRQPVAFSATVRNGLERGLNCFVEVSPHPVLTSSIRALGGRSIVAVPLLRRGDDEPRVLLEALGQLAIEGVGRPRRGRALGLPSVAEMRESCWYEDPVAALDRTRPWSDEDAPIIGTRLEGAPGTGFAFESRISTATHPWLDDHRVAGVGAVTPAALWLELLTLASRHEGVSPRLHDVRIVNPLPVGDEPVVLRVEHSGGSVTASSRLAGREGGWNLHVSGIAGSPEPTVASAPAQPPSISSRLSADAFYDLLAIKGLTYSGPFRCVSDVTLGDRFAAASIVDEESYGGSPHPPWLLDAALQLLVAAAGDVSEQMFLPTQIRSVWLDDRQAPNGRYRAEAHVESSSPLELVGTVRLFTEHGECVAELIGVVCSHNAADDATRDRWQEASSWMTRVELVGAEDPHDLWDDDIDQDPMLLPPLDLDDAEVVVVPDLDPSKAAASVVAEVQQATGDGCSSVVLIGGHSDGWLLGLRRSAEAATDTPMLALLSHDAENARALAPVLAEAGIREAVIHTDRVETLALGTPPPPTVAPAARRSGHCSAYRLDRKRGLVERQALLATPGDAEIIVEPTAASLIWKDVGKFLGTIGAARNRTTTSGYLGAGFVGSVLAAGPNAPVERGARVFGMARQPLRQPLEIDTAVSAVALAPTGVSDAALVAQTLPWMTAIGVIDDTARLRPGERIFVPSGAGALGSALVRLALDRGAEVVTSVGEPWKVASIPHADQVTCLVARGGDIPTTLHREGFSANSFDVVVSTLSGDARRALLALLRPGGRFVDVGKPAAPDEAIPAHVLDRNRTLSTFDIDQLSIDDITSVQGMLDRATEHLIHADEFGTPNVAPLSDLQVAIESLARGQTAGGVVIDLTAPAEAVSERTYSAPVNGTYLISGGYGAVGLLAARWLASRGAAHIVLTGRSGRPGVAASEHIELLRSIGVRVTVAACDVSSRADVDRLLSLLASDGERLNGLVHGAGVIADGAFESIDADQVERSFGAKLRGAHNLLDATAGTPLDFAIFLSSVSSVVGIPVQATYGAANAGLDALARRGRDEGVAACSLQLGPIAGDGMADDETVVRYYRALGLGPIDRRHLFGAFDRAATGDVANLMVADVDWRKIGRAQPAASYAPLTGRIIWNAQAGGAAGLEDLLALPDAQRADLLADVLVEQLGEALGIDRDAIGADQSFGGLGVDSLALIEVQTALNELLDLELNIGGLVTQDSTIQELAGSLVLALPTPGDDDGPS